MAAERRSTFAQAGPLIPSSPAMKYNRFNFKEHMKKHVLKVNSPTYMKKIMGFENAQAETPEEQIDTTRHAQDREASQTRTSRSTTPNGTKARSSTPEVGYLSAKKKI